MDSPGARRQQRDRLIGLRAALVDRPAKEAALRDRVRHWLAQADVRALGFFWPVRGEPDLRDVVADWLAQDPRRVAGLPVIAGAALEFHGWTAGSLMQAGPYGIPVPAHGRLMQPDCLLIPCVGFDAGRYRLGYGGGFYDRTYESLQPWPLAVGVAFEETGLPSIGPQAHDLRLDVVLTDAAQH